MLLASIVAEPRPASEWACSTGRFKLSRIDHICYLGLTFSRSVLRPRPKVEIRVDFLQRAQRPSAEGSHSGHAHSVFIHNGIMSGS